MIPTEPIGSLPRPKALVDAIAAVGRGAKKPSELEPLFDEATRDTIRKLTT